MNNSKKLLTFIAGIVVVGLVIVLSFRFFAPNSERNENIVSSDLPSAGNVKLAVPQDEFLTIGTPRGAVAVKNFYKTALGFDEQFVILENTKNYEISYDTYTSGFSVYISAAPFDANRLAAEKSLLDVLGVSETDACKLNVFEGAASGTGADESLGGLTPHLGTLSVGLSFCGGGLY